VTVALPWDCAVPGVPASLQGSSRKRADWRTRVASAALARWPVGESPLAVPLALTVAFLHSGEPVDVDNMLKPTLDGLIGIAYDDDDRLDQVLGLRRDLREGWRAARVSAVLAGALVQATMEGRPFVYLRLTPPAELEDLLR